MAAVIAGISPGDEVIMPSWTFVSTATAMVLRGGVPVWLDIRPDTLNLDEQAIEGAITARTRAVVPVHYAGIACDMENVLAVAREHGLTVVEDAAHCVLASYRGRALGSLGDLGCLSFDEMKNVTCGEGGALLVRNSEMASRAEIAQAKGTNRASFLRGEVDSYSWVDHGSSWAASELAAAFLCGQLEAAEALTHRRMEIWSAYHAAFAWLEERELVRRPVVPPGCAHNAHLYYLLLPDRYSRDVLIDRLRKRGITAVFHYIPLHSSPAGRRYGRVHGKLSVTEATSDRLVRLPVWPGLDEPEVERVVEGVLASIG
jgi:dTDP-4-amino-4,6-dideoxygalactose transaminase